MPRQKNANFTEKSGGNCDVKLEVVMCFWHKIPTCPAKLRSVKIGTSAKENALNRADV